MKKKKKSAKTFPDITVNKQAKMDEILGELKYKLKELEELKKGLDKKKVKKISAQKTKAMLEEIVVPPLKLIKEPKKKHK